MSISNILSLSFTDFCSCLESTVNKSAAPSDESPSDGTGSSELADTSRFIALNYNGIAYPYCHVNMFLP